VLTTLIDFKMPRILLLMNILPTETYSYRDPPLRIVLISMFIVKISIKNKNIYIAFLNKLVVTINFIICVVVLYIIYKNILVATKWLHYQNYVQLHN